MSPAKQETHLNLHLFFYLVGHLIAITNCTGLQVSNFGYSAWEWNETRQQYYYHAYLPEQPTLNYRNPRVVEEMKVWPLSVFSGDVYDVVKR